MIRKAFAAICLLFLTGCGDSGTESDSGEFIVDFKLIDAAGKAATSFKLGEDINFVFSIINNTGEDQSWTSEHDWPAARFTVQQGADYVGSTYETLPPESHQAGTLNDGDTLLATASWSDHSRHAPPAVGEYIAYALVNYDVDNLPQPFQPWAVAFTVEPPEQGAAEIFAWYRQGELGYCPPVNRIYYAGVVRDADSVYTMSGTTLLDNSMLTMPCLDVGWTDNCLIQVPFADKILTPAESDELEALLAVFPIEEHELNPACDPCLINRYYLKGRIEEINPCASGSELYWETAAAIDTLLHSIITEKGDSVSIHGRNITAHR
jgi:hypothetical protein